MFIDQFRMNPSQNQLSLFEQCSINYGWFGTIAEFLASEDWLETLQKNYQQLYRQRSTTTQNQAWLDCETILRSQLSNLVTARSDSQDWTLIFEYELPGEGGRRPDLVMLAAGHILVFEFKQKSILSPADLDQVAAYARDLAEYHRASSEHPMTAILVPTRYTKENSLRNTLQVINTEALSTYLESLEEISPKIDANAWIHSEYTPLPTVIQAARQIFQNEPLPSIRRAQSAGIPQVLTSLDQLVETAYNQKERHLVLLTGVPGAGKTLVGLQFVYQNPFQLDGERQAIFLSGNASLITVLQYALQSKAFVQAVRNFYIQHEARRQKAPAEHIVVFDEAQRAWDAERMSEKYGITSAAPGAVLRICERSPDWNVLLALIGEGQTIHVGEEGGMEEWSQGLQEVQSDWHIHCASEQAEFFNGFDRLHLNDALDLTMSLRSHLAKNVQSWVAQLLSGDIEKAATLMPSLISEGFNAYLTRDVEVAKTYCRDRYHSQFDKRYGFVASSRSRNLAHYDIKNDYVSTKKVNVGAWYIDPPESPLSCCALESVVTEFSAQGLELDFPIVGWGDDLRWQNSAWVASTRQKNVRDPLTLRLNSYRVLLTRGRDGFVVFVPPEAKMDSTFEVLQLAGLRPL